MKLNETFIVIGPSGSGKGTQIKLLREYIATHYPETDLYYFEAGSHFRDFTEQKNNYTSKIMKSILDRGMLAPDFVTEWFITDALVHHMTGEAQTLIFDGTPRTEGQAKTINAIMEYYGRRNMKVLNFTVPEDIVRERMTSRGRADDIDPEAIENRITWYREKVTKAIEYFRNHADYEVIDINGVGDITEIHHDIIARLQLDKSNA